VRMMRCVIQPTRRLSSVVRTGAPVPSAPTRASKASARDDVSVTRGHLGEVAEGAVDGADGVVDDLDGVQCFSDGASGDAAAAGFSMGMSAATGAGIGSITAATAVWLRGPEPNTPPEPPMPMVRLVA
jgi:hypothetical protein